MPCHVARHGSAVVALVQVEAGLLSFRHVDAVADFVFLNEQRPRRGLTVRAARP